MLTLQESGNNRKRIMINDTITT